MLDPGNREGPEVLLQAGRQGVIPAARRILHRKIVTRTLARTTATMNATTTISPMLCAILFRFMTRTALPSLSVRAWISLGGIAHSTNRVQRVSRIHQ